MIGETLGDHRDTKSASGVLEAAYGAHDPRSNHLVATKAVCEADCGPDGRAAALI
jgi:hypothetical protein